MKRLLANAVEVVPAAKHRRVAADAPAETFLALLPPSMGISQLRQHQVDVTRGER